MLVPGSRSTPTLGPRSRTPNPNPKPTPGLDQIPGLKAAEIDGRLEEAGIDKVYVFCVNDAAVMQAWKKDQGLAGSEMVEFLSDKVRTTGCNGMQRDTCWGARSGSLGCVRMHAVA